MLLLVLIGIILIVTVLTWLGNFYYRHDFTIPSLSINQYRKILAVFPHPDDEVMTAGGVFSKHPDVSLLLLTKGERGTPDAHLDPRLKSIRSKEALKSAHHLKIIELKHHDFGDGELSRKKSVITSEIAQTIKQTHPDLIITYDLSGLYGHPDHMVVSQIVTRLVKSKYPHIALWYFSLPAKTYRHLKLPTHMAEDKNFLKKRSLPTHKVFIGRHIFQKLKAIGSHKSQISTFQKGLPIPIPRIFFDSMTLFEYFHKIN